MFDAGGTSITSGADRRTVTCTFCTGFRVSQTVFQSTGGDVGHTGISVKNSDAILEGNEVINYGNQIEVFLYGATLLPANALVVIRNNRLHNNSVTDGATEFMFTGTQAPSRRRFRRELIPCFRLIPRD